MSRSGYTDDGDNWQLIKWRGAVASAIRGRRGQEFLREMLARARRDGGQGADRRRPGEPSGLLRPGSRLEMPDIYGYDWDYERGSVAALFGVAPALVAEIMYVNDECGYWTVDESPAVRHERVRRWVEGQIR